MIGLTDLFEQVLGSMSGGRVLDVATGEGGFIQVLLDNLRDYNEIVGVDFDELALRMGRSRLDQENIHFVRMDARRLAFAGGSFDTAVVSASLHHLVDVPRVLGEMQRVLRPGGRFFMAEMHRDGRTEAQLTAVYIHHWAAEVDSALGDIHNPTFARQQLVDWIEGLHLDNLRTFEFVDADSDPLDAEMIEQVERYMAKRLQRAEGLSSHETLKRRGEQLCRRLREVGVQREPVLLILGKKGGTPA